MKKELETELRQAGLRITRQRKIILDILCSQDNNHPNAFEIFKIAHEKDSSISLSTVYRTMNALEKHGSIQRHAFTGGPSRFEPTKSAHHDHLIDVESGDVIEFYSDLIEKLQEDVAKNLGYDIVSHRLEIYAKKRKT